MERSFQDLLVETYAGRSSGETHVETATKEQLWQHFQGGSQRTQRREMRPGQRAALPHESRFAQHTETAVRATTTEDALALFLQALANSPIIERIVPQHAAKARQKHRRSSTQKQRVELHFTPAFQEAVGVASVDAAVLLNPDAALNLVSQAGVVVTYDPHTDERYAQAAIYADLCAFLGVWDTWCEVFISDEELEIRENHQRPRSLEEQSLREERLRILHAIQELLGQPLISLIEAQARILEKNRARILEKLQQRAELPYVRQQHAHAAEQPAPAKRKKPPYVNRKRGR